MKQTQELTQAARDWIYSRYAALFNPSLRIRALSHTAHVEAFAAQLAREQGFDEDTAVLAALFHDTATFLENCPSRRHAELSARLARAWLEEQEADPRQIETVSAMIARHSFKDRVDEPEAELLKEADRLAHRLEKI